MEKLQAQINDLQEQIELLKRSSSIPRDMETAFSERLGIATKLSGTGTTTASTQSVSIPATPTSITVPAQPSGALTVTYNGATYNLLYK
jgi:hypothetical protein